MFNLNQASGRVETKKFISLIEEMLERRILIEDFIETNKLKELVKDNKLYRGITISKDVLSELEAINMDEFKVLIKDVDKHQVENERKWEKHYMNHYKVM
jgi:hypothetical protein